MISKNIILIGSNNSGKSTIANELYLQGYHYFKLSPLPDPDNHYHSLAITTRGSKVVFDRWSVVDLYIYRGYTGMLNKVLENPEKFNQNNLVVYLKQKIDETYDYKRYDGTKRSVERPNLEELKKIERRYQITVDLLKSSGINILTVGSRDGVVNIIKTIKQKLEELENEKEE